MRTLLLLSCLLPALPAGAATLTVEGRDSAAIAAAVARAAAGDTVRLPAGTYSLTAPVPLKSGVRLVGAGQEQTLLRRAAGPAGAMLSLRGCEDVEVSGLTLDGAEDPAAQQGIAASDARRLRIHHVTIRNLVKGAGFGPIGIHFNGRNPTKEGGVTDSEIADCLIENVGLGARFGGGIRLSWGSSRNRVLRNVVRDTGRGGIFGDNGSTDLVIRGNTVTGSRGEGLGIEVWGGCHRAVIEENLVDHWLSLDSSNGCAVRRNVVRDHSGVYKLAGLELVASNDCVLTDNLVDGGQRIGISISNKPAKDRVFWGYNTIRGCNQWGAQLQGEEGGIACHYFYRCRFLDMPVGAGEVRYPGAEGHGFRTNGGVRHVTLEECEFAGNGRAGLQLGGPKVDALSFVRCTLRGNKGPAAIGPAGYTELEWVECAVGENGSNTLPAAKPFAHAAPTTRIEAPREARAGLPVAFADTSTAAAGKIARVLWDFGDGTPATEARATHTYAEPGEYRVTLVVWDEAGRGGRAEARVKVAR